MASVVNAIRNVMSDKLWIIKIFVLSIPVYFTFFDTSISASILNKNFLILIILLLIYLGCASVMMNRNINNKSPILPGIFTIPEIIIKSICSAIVALPGFVILSVICYCINSYFVLEEPFTIIVIYTVAFLIVVPFIIIPMVLYSVNGKLTDGLKYNKVIDVSGNFVVAILSFIIQYVFIVILFTYLIYKLFIEMLGEGNLVIPMIYSYVIVFSFLLIFSYSSDLYGDVIPAVKSRRDVI